MRKSVYPPLLALFLILTLTTLAHSASVFRCKGKEVRRGDTTFAVVQKCGQPAYKEEISAKGCEKVERWHYDCKNRRFVDELTFTAGKLTQHKDGERSTGSQFCP